MLYAKRSSKELKNYFPVNSFALFIIMHSSKSSKTKSLNEKPQTHLKLIPRNIHTLNISSDWANMKVFNGMCVKLLRTVHCNNTENAFLLIIKVLSVNQNFTVFSAALWTTTYRKSKWMKCWRFLFINLHHSKAFYLLFCSLFVK